MTESEVRPVGEPGWLELFSSDPDKSVEFYASLFGWVSASGPRQVGDETYMYLGGRPIAGISPNVRAPRELDTWLVHLTTHDAHDTIERAAQFGSSPQFDRVTPKVGRQFILCDTTGACVGVWEPGGRPVSRWYGEHGSPVWRELYARDFPAAQEFYRDVFNWRTQLVNDSAGGRYLVETDGRQSTAGILDASSVLPDDVGSSWLPYFAIDNLDFALETIPRLGGFSTGVPRGSEFGRFAHVSDVTGANFVLLER